MNICLWANCWASTKGLRKHFAHHKLLVSSQGVDQGQGQHREQPFLVPSSEAMCSGKAPHHHAKDPVPVSGGSWIFPNNSLETSTSNQVDATVTEIQMPVGAGFDHSKKVDIYHIVLLNPSLQSSF